MLRIVILLLSCLSISVCGQQMADIYRVEAQVTSQSEAERLIAARAHLDQVILRVAGNPAALQHPLVKEAVSNAPNYLAKYAYLSDKTLVLNYSPQAIHALLVRAQLVTETAAKGLTIYVVDVQDFASFKQVQAYLKTVGVIHHLDLVKVNPGGLEFNLQLDGNEELLKTTLNMGNKLQAVVGDAEKPLSFRWQNL